MRQPPKITTAAKAAAVGNGKAARGSSRFRGVSWCEKGQKWRALLWDGSRQVIDASLRSPAILQEAEQ